MQGSMARSQARRTVGLIMGYIEIIRPDGSGLSNKRTNELTEARFDTCDKCGEVKNIEGGRMVEQAGEFIMWWCYECR